MARSSRLPLLLFAAASLIGAGAQAGEVSGMKIERVMSPGGIEAWLVESHANPLIAMRFAFRGGASQDDPGQGRSRLFHLGHDGRGRRRSRRRGLPGARAGARHAHGFRRQPRRHARQCADADGEQGRGVRSRAPRAHQAALRQGRGRARARADPGRAEIRRERPRDRGLARLGPARLSEPSLRPPGQGHHGLDRCHLAGRSQAAMPTACSPATSW